MHGATDPELDFADRLRGYLARYTPKDRLFPCTTAPATRAEQQNVANRTGERPQGALFETFQIVTSPKNQIPRSNERILRLTPVQRERKIKRFKIIVKRVFLRHDDSATRDLIVF